MNHAKTILPALLGLLVLFWTGDKIGYRIRADMEAGVSWLDMADRFWLDLLESSHISTHPTDMLCGLTFVAVAGLAWAYRRAARLTLRNGEEHGSAHWAGPRDIKPFIDPDPAHNLRFTRTERLSTDTRRTLRNLNVLLLGSSGSGKTRYYVKPNLLGADMNWAVTDPKGELKRDTESPMKARGYAVHALDLVDLTRSDRFNPMRYIDPAEPQSAILRLTDNLVTNATGDRKNGDGFWEDAEKALLSALIAWVHYTEDEPTLNHVTDMLDQMGASEQDEEREFIVDALFAEPRVEIAAMRATRTTTTSRRATCSKDWRSPAPNTTRSSKVPAKPRKASSSPPASTSRPCKCARCAASSPATTSTWNPWTKASAWSIWSCPTPTRRSASWPACSTNASSRPWSGKPTTRMAAGSAAMCTACSTSSPTSAKSPTS